MSDGGCGAGALRATSLPARRVPECALQDGLGQVAAVAPPGDPIKVDPWGAWTHGRLCLPPIADGPCRRAPLPVDPSRL